MFASLLLRIKQLGKFCSHTLPQCLSRWTKPASPGLIAGTATDLIRSKPQLLAENALLRQQVLVLRRQVNRPVFTARDRALLVLLASRVRVWKEALFIVRPETILRWHRAGFRLFWRRKSAAASPEPKVPRETGALIQQMARANPLWGAERIRGELFKLGLRVCKRTIQRSMRPVRKGRPPSQAWSTFLRNHATEVWARDFLPVTDLFFRVGCIYSIGRQCGDRLGYGRPRRESADAAVDPVCPCSPDP
jgi:putative transposase